MSSMKIGVVGSGSWATAIVKLLCKNLNNVGWCVRNDFTKDHLLRYRYNPKYLQSVHFPLDKLHITTDINELATNYSTIILATPSIYLESALKPLTVSLQDKLVVSAIKGIVPGKWKIVGEYMHDKYAIPYDNIGVISGPCHAEEVAMDKLSYLTVSAKQPEKVQLLSDALGSKYLKTTKSDDIFGTEYASVLKNIYAIAAGIAHGLGYGDNYQAVLMSNAIREMKDFLNHIHPINRNINNSSYLGDLLVTAYSNFSRNRMFGTMIGKGYTVKAAILNMNMVAEGYYATKGIHKILLKHQLKLNICDTVYKILYEDNQPASAMRRMSNKMN